MRGRRFINLLGRAGGPAPPSFPLAGSVLDENFLTAQYFPGPIASDLVDTRSTTKFVTNLSGLLSSVAINTLPISNAGMLVEPAATTIMPQSDFASWTVSGGTLTLNAVISPDGTTNAATYTCANGQSIHAPSASFVSGVTYEFSTYAKGTDQFGMSCVGGLGGAGGSQVNFDPVNATAVVASGTGVIASVSPLLANGFRRFSFTVPCTQTVTNVGCFIFPAGAGSLTGLALYKANVTLPPLSSPITAGASPVTRSADAITVQHTGIATIGYTFSDGSTQSVFYNPASQPVINPATLSKPLVTRMTGFPLGNIVPSYLGQVATRSGICYQLDTTNKQLMGRRAYFARSAFTNPRFVINNFYVNGVSGYTEASLGTSTFTASWETAGGTIIPATFSGASSIAVNSAVNGLVITDPISVTVAKNETFYLRLYMTNPIGVIYSVSGGATALGDCCNVGVSGIPDQTTSGSVTVGIGGSIFFPAAAIIAQTTAPSYYLAGDSRTLGFQDSEDSSGDVGNIARSVGPNYAYINGGVSGHLAQGFAGAHFNQAFLANNYCSGVFVQLGINDVQVTGRTSAQVLADRQTIIGLFSTKAVYSVTMEPWTTSTDSWATPTLAAPTTPNNQTLTTNDGIISTVNAAISALETGVFKTFDIASKVSIGRYWQGPGLTPEGIHADQTGQLLIKNSGVIALP